MTIPYFTIPSAMSIIWNGKPEQPPPIRRLYPCGRAGPHKRSSERASSGASRLREQDTERAYEDWQLRLSFEPVEQVQEALTQHWNTYDEYLSWTDPASASLWQETLDRLNEQYTAACLVWYDKWAEFHPEPDVQ